MSNFELSCSYILFDLDGVLVDSRECVEAIWVRWAEEHGMDARTIIHAAHGRRTSETLRSIAPHLDVAAEVAALDRLEEVETRGIRAVPGAAELIASIPNDRWAIVTSGSIPVARLRLTVGKIPVPRVFVTAEDVREGKPSPQGYLLAAQRFGCTPSECVVVEDAPAGIGAGKNAGMRVIGVAGNYLPSALTSADEVVSSLSQLRVRTNPDGTLLLTGTRARTD